MPHETTELFELPNRMKAHQLIGMHCVRDSSGKHAMQVSRRPIACGLGANSPTPLEARPNKKLANNYFEKLK
jgi:hypothetical protein